MPQTTSRDRESLRERYIGYRVFRGMGIPVTYSQQRHVKRKHIQAIPSSFSGLAVGSSILLSNTLPHCTRTGVISSAISHKTLPNTLIDRIGNIHDMGNARISVWALKPLAKQGIDRLPKVTISTPAVLLLLSRQPCRRGAHQLWAADETEAQAGDDNKLLLLSLLLLFFRARLRAPTLAFAPLLLDDDPLLIRNRAGSLGCDQARPNPPVVSWQ